MSLLSGLVVSLFAGMAVAQEEGVVFIRANPSPSASSNSAAPSSAASSATPSNTASSAGLPAIGSSASTSAGSSATPPTTTNTGGGLQNAPTISGAETYSYPPPSVPPTANAPFMRKSNLPNGTVFICVGAIIGGLFVAVFLWRAWAVWALHRRMNAANQEYSGVPTAPSSTVTGAGLGHEKKSAVLRKSGTGFYNQGGAGSGYNMGEIKRGGYDRKAENSSNAGNGGNRNASNARQSSLFFSPTMGAGAHGTAAQRASSYLPAGYYAAGSTVGSTVVNVNSTSDLTASRSQLSMSDFMGNQRQSERYKDSPLLRPQSGFNLDPPNAPYGRQSGARGSTSSLGTHSDRAPSAYLEDLFNTKPTEQRGSDERRRY